MNNKQTEQEKLLEIQMKAAPKARIFDILLIATMMLVVFGLAIAMFIVPDKEFSEQENRYLMQFPEISDDNNPIGKLIEGSFTKDIAKYYADQLPLRDVFTGLKGIAEIGLLKRENNGVLLINGDFLVTKDSPPDYDQLQSNIDNVEAFAKAMGGLDVPVTLAMAPRTIDLLRARDELPSTYPVKYSEDLWEFYGENVTAAEYTKSINLLDELQHLSNGDIYYRTDHHWNTLGAYIAYSKIFTSIRHSENETLLSYARTETASDEFYGTTWSKAGMKWVKPDTLEYYRYDGDEDFITTIVDTGASFNGFYDRSYLDKKDKYGSFISGVNTRVEIHKPGEKRPKLLLIKDSFAHSVVPFLAYHYDLIILDLRAFSITQSIAQIVEEENIEQVLFLYNIANFMESRDLGKLLNGLDEPDESDNKSGESDEPAELEFEEGFTSRQIIDKVMEAFNDDELPENGVDYFYKGADSSSENYLGDRSIANHLQGGLALPDEFAYIYDYAFIVPTGYDAFEIDILRVSKHHAEKIDIVKTMLEERFKGIDSKNIPFYKETEAWIVSARRIITIDNYAILLQTTDNDKAEKIIRELLSGELISQAPSVSEPETAMVEPKTTTAEITETAGVTEVKTEAVTTTVPEPETTAISVSDSANVTQTPILTVKKYSHNTSYIFGGICEESAWIEVTGGTETVLTQSNHGDFLVEVPFDGNKSNTNLTVRAIVDGKEPSKAITTLVKPQTGISMYEDRGIFGVIVGYNYMSFFDDCLNDYIGANLISDNEITQIKERTEKKIDELKSHGNNAEIIYLLVPNPVRIYPENMPKRYTEHKGDSLKHQWIQGVTAGGADVIDLTNIMLAHKNDDYKIFNYTDSHWTEYGAMLGYNELMNHIAKKFPDAAPRPASDFQVYNRRVYFGDIYYSLGLPKDALREMSTFVKFNFDPPCGHINLYDDIDSVRLEHSRVEKAQTTKTNLQGDFPSAYILRDSFAGPLHAFLTDRFSQAEWLGMWNYKFKADEIAKNNPDYVIYIINERNIKNVMYE